MKTLAEVDELLDMLTFIRYGEGIKYPEYPIFCSDDEFEEWSNMWKNFGSSCMQVMSKEKPQYKVGIDAVVYYAGYKLLYIKTSNLKKQINNLSEENHQKDNLLSSAEKYEIFNLLKTK